MSQFSYTKKPEWNNDGLRPNHVSTNVFATPYGWMAPMPGMGGKTVTGITWLTGTATVTCTGHGLVTGTDCMIYGVSPTGYNGYYPSVTVVDANTFTVPVSVASLSPLTTPTAPTGVGSGTGGTVAAATYYAKIVAVDGNGATTLAGAEVAVGVTTTGATSSIAWSWTAVPGAVSYQIWVGTATGAETSFFTSTTNSYTQTTSAGTAGTIPTANPGTYVSGGSVSPRGEILAAINSLQATNSALLVIPTFTAAFTFSNLAHMVTGDVATITLTSTDAVYWNTSGGVPSVTLNVNATPRQMTFKPALSTTTSLVFNYTIVAGDVATAGQVTTGTSITLNGGQFLDSAPDSGNEAGTHNAPFTPGTFVAPTTSGVSVN